MAKQRVVALGELEQGEIRPVTIDGRKLLLVEGEAGPALIDAICPHAGGDLAKGKVTGNRIRCPTHSYLFNLETGVCPLGRREGWGPLAVYELEASEGYLWAEITG